MCVRVCVIVSSLKILQAKLFLNTFETIKANNNSQTLHASRCCNRLLVFIILVSWLIDKSVVW